MECTAKKDMDKSNKYQWHVVCTRTEESSHGEIKGHGRSQHILYPVLREVGVVTPEGWRHSNIWKRYIRVAVT